MARLEDNILRIRESKGISQIQVAYNCGLNPAHFNRIENGEQRISLSTLYQIAKGLGVKADELLKGVTHYPSK